jgi:hypothetical protein
VRALSVAEILVIGLPLAERFCFTTIAGNGKAPLRRTSIAPVRAKLY